MCFIPCYTQPHGCRRSVPLPAKLVMSEYVSSARHARYAAHRLRDSDWSEEAAVPEGKKMVLVELASGKREGAGSINISAPAVPLLYVCVCTHMSAYLLMWMEKCVQLAILPGWNVHTQHINASPRLHLIQCSPGWNSIYGRLWLA